MNNDGGRASLRANALSGLLALLFLPAIILAGCGLYGNEEAANAQSEGQATTEEPLPTKQAGSEEAANAQAEGQATTEEPLPTKQAGSEEAANAQAEEQGTRKEPLRIEQGENGTLVHCGRESAGFYQLTQLPFPVYWGGAAYSLLTPEGELYLIDGGFREEDSGVHGGDGQRLWEHVQAHGGKVKGWILTHPHLDHVGAFLDYMAAHGDTVETVYYSPFTTGFFTDEQDPEVYQLLNGPHLHNEFMALKEGGQGQTEYIPLEVGDKLFWGEMELECFASFDFARKDINGNSLVFTLSYGGYRVLLTGDMTEATLTSIQETAAADSAIRDVDIIQIPHHGYLGDITGEALYRLANPELALLDVTEYEYMNNSADILATMELMEELGIPVAKRFESVSGNRIFLYE